MKPEHLEPYASALDAIGWTPLLRPSRVGAGGVTPVYGNAEYANEAGLPVDGSAGLNVERSLQIAREVNDSKACVVTILCDTGERSLSKVVNTVEQLLAKRSKGAPELVSVAPAALVQKEGKLIGTRS